MEGMHIILSDKRENQTAIAQQANKIQVKGNVTDMAGEPVIGASILEKGTTNGIVTDFNGDFSLNVNPGAVLVVSYIGYSAQEVKVIPGKVLKIKIKEDAELLDEVVVVGYGTQKKVNLTGAGDCRCGCHREPSDTQRDRCPARHRIRIDGNFGYRQARRVCLF